MVKIVSLILAAALLVSCATGNKQTPKAQETYISHTVGYSGETLGVISSWYTGSVSNWGLIADANPNIQVKSIRIGDTIRIPERLVKRHDPLPQDFITGSKTTTSASNQTAQVEQAIEVSNYNSAPPESGSEKDINAQLYEAVLFSDGEKTKSLLAQGADANHMETNRPMLHWASQNGSVEVVEALIAGGAKKDVLDGVGHTPLMRAVDMSQSAIVTTLINAKVDLNVKSSDGKTALYMATSNGSSEMTKLLVDAGANPDIGDDDGMYPALLAIQYGYTELVPILAAAKADFNANNHIIYTPLLLAIEQDNKDLVEELLKAGANPNVKSQSGRIPLLAAFDSAEIFALLLQNKADPNVTNDIGRTALMVAVENDSADRARELIKAGADVNVKDNGGGSALTLAQNMSLTELVELLKSSGATE